MFSVIIYKESVYILDAALVKAISDICTLGNRTYVQNNGRPDSRCYLTNFVSCSLLQLYTILYGWQ